jgi:CheY-like chemotaxis protein
VEDDDAAFAVVSIIVNEQNLGLRLFRARDSEEAFAFLHQRDGNQPPTPDLILLDLNLPGKNGLQILSELKANPSLRTIPVVMFSTSAAENDRHDALERGARAYITKPTSFELLVDAVRKACSPGESSASA